MRYFLLAVMLLGAPVAAAQSVDPASAPPPERIAIGVSVAPAYELGADFWFLSAVRVSGRATPRVAFDVEAGNVAGASNSIVRFHRQYRARARIQHVARDPNGVSRYWIAGVFALPANDFVRRTARFERRTFTGLTFGYGGEASAGRRVRVWNEVGVDGGDSVRVFATVGVKYRF